MQSSPPQIENELIEARELIKLNIISGVELQDSTSSSAQSTSLKRALLHNLAPLSCLIGSHLFVDIYNSLLPIISPILVLKFSLGLTDIGFLSALLSFTGAFMQPIYGYLSDRFNSKNLVLLAPIMLALGVFGIGFSTNILTVCLCLCLMGTGFSLFHPKATALMGSLSTQYKSSFLSLFVAGGSLGSSLSPIFILLFVSEKSQNLSNLSWSAIVALIAFVLLFVFYRIPHPEISNLKPKIHLPLKQVISLCLNRDLVLLTTIVTLRSMSILSLIAFVSSLITHSWGWSLVLAGYAAAILNVGSLIGGLFGGFVADRTNHTKIEPKFVLLTSFVLSVPCLMLFVINHSLVFLALGAFFSAWSNSICVSLSQKSVPKEVQSTASSLTMGFAWGVGALIIPLIGFIADKTDNLGHTLLFALSLPLLGAAFCCLFLGKKA